MTQLSSLVSCLAIGGLLAIAGFFIAFLSLIRGEPSHFYQRLQQLSGQVLLLDATERAISRSVDKERQRHEYSGKKDCHTLKNLLVIQPQKSILYLRATVAGCMHDKALADEMELEFLPEQCLLLGLGFVGYEPEGAQTLLPIK